jgi:hypothetical protein
MTIPGSPEAREIARQLLERETAGVTEAAELGAAMQRACARVSEDLRRSIGNEGYDALLARALAIAEAEQPVLQRIRRVDPTGIHLHVAAGVEHHGPTAVHVALESFFARLVEVLSELIGVDMVRNLLIADPATPSAEGNTQ